MEAPKPALMYTSVEYVPIILDPKGYCHFILKSAPPDLMLG